MKEFNSTKVFGKQESVQFVEKVLNAANCQFEPLDIERKFDSMNQGDGLTIDKINKLIVACIKPRLA